MRILRRGGIALIMVLCCIAALPVMGQIVPGAITDGANFTPKYSNPIPSKFPIGMWGVSPILGNQKPSTWYRNIAGCGVNILLGAYQDTVQLQDAMTESWKQDLYMLPTALSDKDYPYISKVVGKFRTYPNMLGYLIRDEPSYNIFKELRKVRDVYYSLDTTQLLLCNLYPITGEKQLGISSYIDYVEEYVKVVKPALLSFDNYPIRDLNGVKTVSGSFFQNLEDISRIAYEKKIPFWAFGLVYAHFNYPEATLADLRFEVFNALAYGAQGLIYYRYQMLDVPDFKSKTAPVDNNGVRTPVWYRLRQVNREIQALSGVFLGCEVMDVSHTGKTLPAGTKRLTRLPSPVIGLSSGDAGVLVSHLRNGDSEYMVIVNHDVVNPQQISLRWNGTIRRISEKGRSSVLRNGNMTLAPGSYAIFRL